MSRETEGLEVAMRGLSLLRAELAKAIVGQEEAVELSIVALLCGGHVLFEGVPGIGKTLLARSLARCLGVEFSRIQFTPDLMPADVVGTAVVSRKGGEDFELRFERGPVFTNVLLADEINRASPKTQSALLEAMQEGAVTSRGTTHPLPRPFMVLATQNPIEMEGTYPLPEAQVDRFFFKILVGQPDAAELVRILALTVGAPNALPAPVLSRDEVLALQAAVREVVAPPFLLEAAARMVLATQPGRSDSGEKVRRYLRYGAGPRGAQALVLAAKATALARGRFHAGMEDLSRVALPALRHRLAINYEGLGEGLTTDSILAEVIERTSRVGITDPALEA